MHERLSKNSQGRREPDVRRRGPLLVQSANPTQLVYLPRPHRVKKSRGMRLLPEKRDHPLRFGNDRASLWDEDAKSVASTEARIRFLDEPTYELARVVTAELSAKVEKATFRELRDDLYRHLGQPPLRPDRRCDAITADRHLHRVLDQVEKCVAELASGYSTTRWLWYLRRMPMLVFWGQLSTTFMYDSALAEISSGNFGTGIDNLRTREDTLYYPIDESSARRLLRFCHMVRMMSDIHTLLRYAGKSTEFVFPEKDSIPSPLPSADQERAIRLYDERRASAQRPFLRGGTTLLQQDSNAQSGIITVQRVKPHWLPCVIGGLGGLQKNVEVYANFLPQLLTFDRLSELNADPRLSGRVWLGPEAVCVFSLLSVAPCFIPSLRHAFASLMQNGYFVIDDELFCRLYTERIPFLLADLSGLLRGQSIPTTGEQELTALEEVKGSLWPLRFGPVVRRNGKGLWIDLFAATSVLDVLLEFPRTPGEAIANARADHFEDTVQRVIDASPWRPEEKIRGLRRKELKIGGKSISDIDALGTRGKSVILVSCKSLVYSSEYDIGDYRTVRNTASTVVDAIYRWQGIIEIIKANPVGDNFDFSGFDDFVSVVCTPYPVYVPLGLATQELRPRLRAAVSEEELGLWLNSSDK
jgi:hypothetical protein